MQVKSIEFGQQNNTRSWQAMIWPTGNQQHFYLHSSALLPSAWHVT